jgi:hypothetical protein
LHHGFVTARLPARIYRQMAAGFVSCGSACHVAVLVSSYSLPNNKNISIIEEEGRAWIVCYLSMGTVGPK